MSSFNKMFSRLWLLNIVLLITLDGSGPPGVVGLHVNTTCEEFERGAQFDPYKLVDSMWKIIYFWSDTTEVRPIIFSLIEKKRLSRFKDVVDAISPDLDVEWHKVVIMMEPRPGTQVLLMYSDTPGAFRAIIKMEQRDKVRPHPEPLLKFADLRLKVEGRYLGMMCCEDLTAFVLVRSNEVPTTEEECVAAATTLGLRGPGGRSYLLVQSLIRTEL